MAAEKIARLGIKRDVSLMYYIKNGDVWAVPRQRPGDAKGKAKRVAAAGIEMDFSRYLYFLDNDGDVARLARQIGTSPPPRPAKVAPAKKKKAKKATTTKAVRTGKDRDKDKDKAVRPGTKNTRK